MPDTQNTTVNQSERRELRYEPASIEEKWAARWSADPAMYAAESHQSRLPKFYVLEMLPYPSGVLHMGHVRNYAIGDALARYLGINGYNVLHPMRWKPSRSPAENQATTHNTPPHQHTLAHTPTNKHPLTLTGL